MGPRRLLCVILILAVLLGTGCPSVGRTAHRYFDWGGETFSPNPVAVFPYIFGLIVFFIAGLPLDVISWPIAAVVYDDAEKQSDEGRYWFAAGSPSIFLGTSGGVLLAAPFYPFGIPFIPDDAAADAWNETLADDGPLGPPPGGTLPPEPEAPAGPDGR